jgi:glucose-6-phosphate isomerase
MSFNPGLAIRVLADPLGFEYAAGVFGPQPELRTLDAIRPSLRDPRCGGPDPVYAIAMDVGKRADRAALEERKLLVGVVTCAAGRLGDEPVRTQGHVHVVSSHSGWSPPELYEIWSGTAFIYMQEFVAEDPGRCFAICASPGERVIVPPGWAHATVSADARKAVTFGALCDREYGFLYDEVRLRNGLAWYATLETDNQVKWRPNPHYREKPLEVRGPSDYSRFGLRRGVPLYSQVEQGFDRFQWVSKPGLIAALWKNFAP